MNRIEFDDVIDALGAGLDRNIQLHQRNVWFKLMERFPVAPAAAAVVRYLSEAKDAFVPAPGVIVQMIVEAMEGKAEPAEAAYQRLCRARLAWGADVDTSGSLRVRKHIDERLWRVIEGIGGWQRFCGEREGSAATEWAQFRDAWNKAVQAESAVLAIPAPAQPRLRSGQPGITKREGT